jgi:hypothetical protein
VPGNNLIGDYVRIPRRLFTLATAFSAALVITSPGSAPTASAASRADDAGPIQLASGGWYTCRHDMHANVENEMDVRNNGGQPMCIGSPNWTDDFTVYHSSATKAWENFPNVFTGCELDGNLPQLCTSGHARPIKVSSIRSDASSVRYYYPQQGFKGDAAYDIWFNKTGNRPQGRDNGAELMIWLGANDLGRPAYTRSVKIDGIWWGYMTWNARRPGHTWHYIRYWRISGWTPHSAATLNLLSFFKDAERTRRLSSSWYLTGTEFGFELCRGGRGLQVADFTDRITA